MTKSSAHRPTQDRTEKYVTVAEPSIEWSNLIFLPFHPVFRMFVVAMVFIKAVLVRSTNYLDAKVCI